VSEAGGVKPDVGDDAWVCYAGVGDDQTKRRGDNPFSPLAVPSLRSGREPTLARSGCPRPVCGGSVFTHVVVQAFFFLVGEPLFGVST